ncbi:MAG TPA: hypothetical protein VK779_13040 [Rhizomicrobium sp.]|nr:hypothetical protein [Rhizomicrobium sp.]
MIDLNELGGSAALYPQKLGPQLERALVVRMSEVDYRAASFLDERMFTRQMEAAWVPVGAMEARLSDIDVKPLHFIFHIGHVGSTLLSRLLDEGDGVLSLREPLPLRTLAELYDFGKAPDALFETFLKLWSRGFDSTRAVVLKATSSVARLGNRLMDAQPDARAVYLSVAAEPYIATLLAGPYAASDLNGFGPERLSRLRKLLNDSTIAQPKTLGELAAMSWLTEKLTQQSVLAANGARVLPVDFEKFLTATDESLTEILQHFGFDASPARIASLMRSPALTRYSKSPDQAYSRELRAQVLQQSREHFADEIKRALKWIEALVQNHEAVAAII